MSGGGSWSKKARLRDRSDYNIRGKHDELGVVTVCQQTSDKKVACQTYTPMFLVASVPTVLCKDAFLVFAHIHGRVCCLVWLLHHVERLREQSSDPVVFMARKDSVEYDE